MVTVPRLLFVVQIALLLLLSSSMVILSQAWFGVLLLSKAYQLTSRSQQSMWSIKRANALALIGIALFIALLPELGVVHLMIHLLYFAAVLRLLSLRWQHKDAEQLFVVHYVLLACAVILQQQFWFAAAVLLVALLNLAAQWIWSAQGDDMPNQSGTLVVSSLVLMVTLFFAVPHLSPFWQVPSPKMAKTGIAAELSANAVGQLLSSDSLAFRVTFDQPAQVTGLPLYFRARIYDEFDGQRWQSPERVQPLDFNIDTGGIGYQVIVEPHQQQWLFNMGVATDVSNNEVKTSQFGILFRQKPVTQRIAYHVTSIATIPRTEQSVRPFLQLPTGANSKTVQRGQQAIIQGLTPLQVVNQIQTFFLKNQFVYSTAPGSYPGLDGVDMFMEQGRKGFCVHYAQAAVIWLRAAGVPARLVGGYLGGQWQNGDEYLRVTQAEAHAWVEYLDGAQWQTFDPTLLIYPELSLSQEQADPNALFGNLAGDFWGQGHLGGFLIQLARDLDYYWANKVLSFEQEDQAQAKAALRDWLDQHWWQVGSATLGIGMVVAGLLLWRRWNQRPLAERMLGTLYRHKQPEETVNQLFERLMREQPAQQQALRVLQQGYAEYVYQGKTRGFFRCYWQARRLSRRATSD